MLARMLEVRSFRSSADSPKSVDAMRFAFSVIITGVGYTQAEKLLLWNDILPPASSTFYEAQKHITSAILAMARESCEKWRNRMLPDSCIAFDGSWSHRRNADHCLVDFIDCRSQKVVDFEIVVRTRAKSGDFDGASNAMECEGLRRMIPRWIEFGRVTAYVHDKDAKTRKVITESGWDIKEEIDPNHLMKSFRRKFKKFQSLSPTEFRGIVAKLESYFKALLRRDEDAEWKKSKWMNVVRHFDGDHSDCEPHSEVPRWIDIDRGENRELLSQFLAKSSALFDRCTMQHSTQMCESLHAVKAHFADKMVAWKTSWAARIAAAILSVNEANWMFELYSRLGLPPLAPQALRRLRVLEQNRVQENERRRDPVYRKKENARRKARSQAHNLENQHSLYKGIGVQKGQRARNGKRKYRVRTMPAKLGGISPWFKAYGFDGTAADDAESEEEEENVWEEEEEEAWEHEWSDGEREDVRICLRMLDEEDCEIEDAIVREAVGDGCVRGVSDEEVAMMSGLEE